MAGPERRFIERVHRKLHTVSRLCTTGIMGANGVYDYYYEGPNKGILWVEYKAVPNKLPKLITLNNPAKKPSLSILQQRWGKQRTLNRVPNAVVLGSEVNGIIFPWDSWDREKPYELVGLSTYTPEEIAFAIYDVVIDGCDIDLWDPF